jgi:two-component system, NarL family, nitrate/nitrite response regulator NarL
MAQTKSLTKQSASIRVLVADATRLTGRLMADVLKRDRRFAVTDASEGSVLPAAVALMPNVAIISEAVEGVVGRGLKILKELRAAVPKTRTVILLDRGERSLVVEAFRSGARGVFCRSDALETLNKCVHKVHEGQLWASDPHLEFLLEALTDSPASQLVSAQGARLLSDREEDVVRCLTKGLTNVQIASELKLTENTVKNYLFRIFNKLGVSSRVEVVIYAADQSNRSRSARA